jgi:hypothetical protein
LANPEITVSLCAKLGVLQGLCFMYSLNSSDQQCQRIITNCLTLPPENVPLSQLL